MQLENGGRPQARNAKHWQQSRGKLLSHALGRRVVYRAMDDRTFVTEAVAGGVPRDYAELLAAIFHPVAQGWTAAVTDSVEWLSGNPPRSVQASIADLAPRLLSNAA